MNGHGSQAARVVVAQIGARRHYAIPTLLEQAGLLERFDTDLCAETALLRLVRAVLPERCRPASFRRLLARRIEGVPRSKVRSMPIFALSRVFRRDRRRAPGERMRHYCRVNADFGRRVARRGFDEANAVYVFNGAGLEILQSARKQGLATILDQTSPPLAVEEALLAEERRRWPGWEDDQTESDCWRLMAEREEAEWRLADLIVCGSEFVRDGMAAAGGPVAKCRVVPYGTKAAQAIPRQTPSERGPLRVLFVGSVCLRKGVPYLWEAARKLRHAKVAFRVVGPVRVTSRAVEELGRCLDLAGPVPRSAVAREYQEADVFVMPTLSEGSANVCYEALAAGLPVITTPNAGSVVRDGEEGFIVPIRSADALAERIAQLAADAGLRRRMAENALGRARAFSWDRYREELAGAVAQCLIGWKPERPETV